MGKVVIDMNGFYSHFPHIGPVWKLTEETLLTELRQFTQKFYRAKNYFWLIFEVHLVLCGLVRFPAPILHSCVAWQKKLA